MSGGGLGVRDPIVAYVRQWGVREHPVLARCRQETASDPRRGMQIDPEQGALMQTLVQAVRPRRALEVGVFTGYSSTATALAMKRLHGAGARLTACDVSQEFVDRARVYWRAAEVEDVIEARIGPAADSLRALVQQGQADSFDLMFIDADKPSYETYYELGLTLLRSGGLMLIDNMLWRGRVADLQDTSPDTAALRDLAQRIHADERVDMTLATIGDGVSFVVKR
ncbi:MAG TPA: class I SAM-dependent methyltransferase [Phenylobacterium sp.]